MDALRKFGRDHTGTLIMGAALLILNGWMMAIVVTAVAIGVGIYLNRTPTH